MPDYRAYTVGRDGHFIGFEPLVCGDDAEAIEQAKRLVGACDVELWCGPRLVIRLIPPEEKADNIQTQATDAKGIAREIGGELKGRIRSDPGRFAMSNAGLTP
jgi:hypothetical protein